MRVRIFRNLTRNTWTVQARTAGAWRSVAHVHGISVAGVVFHHSEASRLRCVAKGQREVHAWVEGDLSAVVLGDAVIVDKWATDDIRAALSAAAAPSVAPLACPVTYRPFDRAGFYVKATGASIASAAAAAFTMDTGCTAA